MGSPQGQIRKVEVSVENPQDQAAREEDLEYEDRTGVTVLNGASDSRTLITDVTETRYLERVTFAFSDNQTDDFYMVIRIRDENDATVIREVANPANMPFNPSPPIKLVAGWDVEFGYKNMDAAACTFDVAAVHRGEVDRS